jgi:hypothetical protein
MQSSGQLFFISLFTLLNYFANPRSAAHYYHY